jgi:8-hydroxy-5-deazaflavin:NADPH oxidoreductase
MPNKVGILGSGEVGQTLAKGFLDSGYEVMIGSRSPEKLGSWREQAGPKAHVGTFQEAASFGELAVLSTLGQAAESAIDLAGPKNFSGKVLIDTTNPLDFSKGIPPSVLPAFATRPLGQFVQSKLPDAKVVKCFNTIPNTYMFRPKFQGAQMLICGNDKGAKDVVTSIVKQFGWTGSIDVGGIENARDLEALCVLWVKAASATQSFNSMFMLMKG